MLFLRGTKLVWQSFYIQKFLKVSSIYDEHQNELAKPLLDILWKCVLVENQLHLIINKESGCLDAQKRSCYWEDRVDVRSTIDLFARIPMIVLLSCFRWSITSCVIVLAYSDNFSLQNRLGTLFHQKLCPYRVNEIRPLVFIRSCVVFRNLTMRLFVRRWFRTITHAL